ncbi:dienelactone hydrolase family protein [Galbitalea soli]|uniref:Dienelactone hydrolase family protein n=1 Tax=Galbitalea soli TaxID=1268042 RepID=A0A7C9TMW7_9MICO|nr:dienelactone hydrolase family protein [Galbitalea soli]NEM89815.1 dienelactone hydrolase family protein [Galbitalea soli]NYJ30519.1 carboxymethylenebutenolidase [Galbitalea soli]
MTQGLADILIPIDLDGASRGLGGVLGVPEGDGPWPAIVVVHEAFGINEVMRRQVERLVAAGYVVLMPDLFTEGGARKCLTATFRALTSGTGRAYQDIEAARRYLLAREDVTGAVGVIGFCMGGGFALMTASRGFDAASVNYGMLPKDLDAALAGACPIIGSYGAADRTLKGAAAQLDAALDRLGVEHEVTEYPGAGHAFLNDAPSGPVLLRPLLRVTGMGPRPEQASEAWTRIEAFFATHLREGADRA